MKFIFKRRPTKALPKFTRLLMGLCIGFGVALTLSSLTDNETALLVSGTASWAASYLFIA